MIIIQNIIIMGEMGSGKSTIANYLCKKYGYTKFSFGEKIHSECKIHGQETREQMQQYGQMMRHIFGENTWCDYVYNKSLGISKIVIDDGRQLNEYDYYTSKGFLPIGVITEDELRLKRLTERVNYPIDPKTFNHETEVQARQCVRKCNVKIYNNFDTENLYCQIDEIIQGIYVSKLIK